MSKLGSILQPRTLPPLPQNILFSDSSHAVSAMLKSWQNSGIHPIVEVSSPTSEAMTEHQGPQPVSAPHSANDELGGSWMSLFAAEWQVGIETLVPNSVTLTTSIPSITKSLDTVIDTTSRLTQVRQEPVEPSSIETAALAKAPPSYLANKLIEAIQNGSISTVEQVLLLISRQSQSTVAVLLELKENFGQSSNSPLSIDWETGRDANANSFTRIRFTLLNDWSRGAGATKLIIGSDGTTYATSMERWNSTPVYLSPNDALAKVKGSNLKRVRDLTRTSQSMTALRSSKAPRHFKAS